MSSRTPATICRNMSHSPSTSLHPRTSPTAFLSPKCRPTPPRW
jgi:hypothetical protein